MENTPQKLIHKDYCLPFKFQVVRGIELGHLTRVQALEKYGIQAVSTIRNWLKKYGNFDYNYTVNRHKKMDKTLEQRVLELELKQSDKKVILFDMMIAIAEEELDISIRKKSDPELLERMLNKKNKA